MNNFTPPQQQQLQTWAEHRDSILLEIRNYSIELEERQKSSKEAGLALADLHNQIAEARGRLAELDALEERYRNSVATDVAELEARKSRLTAECLAKENEMKLHDARRDEKLANIETLSTVHDKMADQATIVDQVVGQVIEKSTGHLSLMKEKMDEVSHIATSVIEKANANLEQTNIVLEKMPKFIFDMQKPIPVRRTYPAGHPRAVTAE